MAVSGGQHNVLDVVAPAQTPGVQLLYNAGFYALRHVDDLGADVAHAAAAAFHHKGAGAEIHQQALHKVAH